MGNAVPVVAPVAAQAVMGPFHDQRTSLLLKKRISTKGLDLSPKSRRIANGLLKFSETFRK
jgi:hypothetical protein